MYFKTWMLSALLTTGLLNGCTTTSDDPLGKLPVRDLQIAPQPPASGGGSGGSSGGVSYSSGYRNWRYIVVHHSATTNGSAASFDAMHRKRGWDGLGYHFVIDNGNGGPDGRVETGPRWKLQKWGAHTGNTPNNRYNNYGIGICLVGDFSDELPSKAQLASLQQLVTQLAMQFNIPAENIIGHRDAPGTATECPGDQLHRYIHGTLQRNVARQLAAR